LNAGEYVRLDRVVKVYERLTDRDADRGRTCGEVDLGERGDDSGRWTVQNGCPGGSLGSGCVRQAATNDGEQEPNPRLAGANQEVQHCGKWIRGVAPRRRDPRRQGPCDELKSFLHCVIVRLRQAGDALAKWLE